MSDQETVVRALLDAIDDKRMLVLATVVRAEPRAGVPVGAKLLVDEDQRVTGTLGEPALDARVVRDALAAMQERKSHVVSYKPGDELPQLAGEIGVFLEVVEPQPELVIVGAGHIAVPLAQMGKMLGFAVTVLDDREKFANRERFPDADRVIAADFGPTLASLKITRGTYIVIVTRGHQYDEEALQQVIDSPAAYIGMIGSRRRVRAVADNLAGYGIDRALFERVRAPIGLEIGAQTPEEIAVSIIAEIIAVRRGGRGLPMSEVARNRALRVAR
ncbi:MAG TPA: XdhC/CoxI family protein [Chloroflexota bacterium]|jgi:xanthine dehydrogenase accessory factor|nr:XdhC/CoxI family protein [Chloroflexota bacterium]